MRISGPIALLLVSASVQAQSQPVTLDSAVFVERSEGAARVVEGADRFRKGERVVTVLRWQALGGTHTVVSPVPPRLQFEGASEDEIEVSADGGRSWKGLTHVQPERVTHLRWRVGSGPGRLTYSAIVR